MKKILNIILVLLLTILLIPNVFASNNVTIESISLKEKSEDLIELSKPTINGMNLGFNLSFLNLGDKAKYEVIISNNSNKEFYIDNQTKFNKSNYITYTYEFAEKTDRIKPNSTLKMYITIEYTSPVPPEKLVNGMYTEDNAMSMDLSDVIITNPSTYANIIALLLIFITLIVVTILNISKKKKIGLNILLIGLLFIPITSYALERITIKATTKITIEEERHIIESRYGETTFYERDFWQYHNYIKTVTFETKIEEPSNYAYKFDVSEKKDNSIIAYLIQRTDDQTLYDLYIMCNGYIYANPDSSEVFSIMNKLKEINNIDNYKTIYATTMRRMFSSDCELEELDLSSWDTSNVTDMAHMFSLRYGSGGYGLLKKLNLSSFDTSKVTNMEYMFSYCGNLTELDISNFDTSKVTNMDSMFSYCENLTRLDLSNFNTSNVTNMYCMFYNCRELEELDISNFNTSKVTNMAIMFDQCYKLERLEITSFDTSKVTDMNYMFTDLHAIKELDLSSFDTSNVIKMYKLFENDSNLETIYVSNKWNTNNVTASGDMFKGCTKLPNFDPTKVDSTNANTSSTGYLTLKS